MTVKYSNWQNIQQYIWLIGGLLCLLIALTFWVITDTRELVSDNKQIEETQVLIQPEKVATSTNLGGLTEEVRPLQLTTRVVAVGHHLNEFRGTKFFQEHQKDWAIELFRATNEDVIKSFLLKQNNRKGLIYFRLSGENHAEQYVLALGPYNSENDAKNQLESLNISLPRSVKPKTVKLVNYSSLVNDLGSDELMSTNSIYAVNLRPVALPLIDETIIAQQRAILAMNDSMRTTTKTTLTRKDSRGNVVDIQRSQTTNEPARSSRSSDNQISDPFN